jgi:uncharacterized protein (DUF433 family)
MDFSSYLEFLAPRDIRVRGSRIGIETILTEYLHDGRTPEMIVQRHPGLSLADVYCTLAYYFDNKDAVDAYLSNWIEESRRARERQQRNPSPAVARLRAIKYGGSNGAASHD